MCDDSFQPTRQMIVATLLLLVCCLFSSVRMILVNPSPRHVQQDDIAARSDERFSLVKKRLPSEGVIGYIGEPSESSLPDYYLAQYALAPLVVDDSTNHAIVVGNFPSSKRPEIPSNLTLTEDCGNGVLLYAAREAQ